MSLDTSAPRTRRALLGAALGAVAATAATAIGRAAPVRAGTDGDVVLGQNNRASMPTVIENATNDNTVLAVASDPVTGSSGVALLAFSPESVGVSSRSVTGLGVLGGSETGCGVEGYAAPPGPTPAAPAKTGVYGYAAQDAAARGVCGETTLGTGVLGRATAGGIGVIGDSSSSVGVLGSSATGSGVHGDSGIGCGVHGTSQVGTGVKAETYESGIALDVVGRARFSRSGRTTVSAGRSYVDIDLTAAGGLGGSPLIFATLQTYRSGVYVAAARKNYPSTGKFRIYLNKAVTASTYVAWVVFG